MSAKPLSNQVVFSEPSSGVVEVDSPAPMTVRTLPIIDGACDGSEAIEALTDLDIIDTAWAVEQEDEITQEVPYSSFDVKLPPTPTVIEVSFKR